MKQTQEQKQANAEENIAGIQSGADFIIQAMKRAVSSDGTEFRDELIAKSMDELMTIAVNIHSLLLGGKIVDSIVRAVTQEKLSLDPSLVHDLLDILINGMNEDKADDEALAKVGADE